MRKTKMMNEIIEYFDNEPEVEVITGRTVLVICSKCGEGMTLEDEINWDSVRHIRCDDELV